MPESICPECDTPNEGTPRCPVCGVSAPDPGYLRAGPPPDPPSMLPMPPVAPALSGAGTAGRPRSGPWAVAGAGLMIVLALAGAGHLVLDTGTDPGTADAGIVADPSVTGTFDDGTFDDGSTAAGSLAGPEVPDVATPAESPAPGPAGMVSIEAEAAADPRTPQIAAMFDAYFTAINAHDAPAAAGAFAPGGLVDPGDPEQVASFGADIATTRDSDVRLWAVADDAHTGDVIATVSFTSTQAPGYGPPERRDETCTDWRLDFRLRSWEGQLLILGTAPGAVCAPCG